MWSEIEFMWRHPDWTAREVAEALGRTEAAVRKQRERYGRWNQNMAPTCRCGRPVWMESPKAKRYGLCKGCYLDEERMRLEDEARAVALRQRRRKLRKRQQAQGGSA